MITGKNLSALCNDLRHTLITYGYNEYKMQYMNGRLFLYLPPSYIFNKKFLEELVRISNYNIVDMDLQYSEASGVRINEDTYLIVFYN